MNNLGPERIHYDQQFCKHRRVIVKRWQEANKFFAILRCRWCDEPWQRKMIVLDQDASRGQLKMFTLKFIEDNGVIVGERVENNSSKDMIPLQIDDLSTETGEMKPQT